MSSRRYHFDTREKRRVNFYVCARARTHALFLPLGNDFFNCLFFLWLEIFNVDSSIFPYGDLLCTEIAL